MSPRATALIPALVMVAAVVAPGRGQTPAQTAPAPTGFIAGQVVDGVTNQPVNETIVTLSGGALGQGGGFRGGGLRVITDSQGRFFFRGLAQGTYSIGAAKPGYVNGSYGKLSARGGPASLALGDGERFLDGRILVWKHAAIVGRVVDEAGEPVVGASVRVLRSMRFSGRPGFASAGTGITDDRGVYRIGSLAPDRYIVAVPSTSTTIPAGMVEDLYRSGPGEMRAALEQAIFGATATVANPGSAANQRIGDLVFQAERRVPLPPIVNPDESMATYPAVFYSQSQLPQDAVSFVIGAGDTRSGVDFQLRSVPTVRVSGNVVGPDGPVGRLALRLVRPGADRLFASFDVEVATTVADPSGAFTFLGVPPGQYVVRAMKEPPVAGNGSAQITTIQTPSGTVSRGVAGGDAPRPPRPPALWVDQDVVVGDRDLKGLRLTLQPGFRISGRLEFEGSSTHQAASRFRPFFETADYWLSGFIPEITIAADGTFVSGEVPSGQYRLTCPTPEGWFVKGVVAGGRDLSDLPFDLKEDISDVVITLSDRGAVLSGAVRDDRSAPDATATVILFPTDARHWIDFSAYPRRIKDVRSQRNGAFEIKDLPAGDYFVVAIPQTAVDWNMPGFFDVLSRVATRQTLGQGERKSIDLRTAQLPGPPR